MAILPSSPSFFSKAWCIKPQRIKSSTRQLLFHKDNMIPIGVTNTTSDSIFAMIACKSSAVLFKSCNILIIFYLHSWLNKKYICKDKRKRHNPPAAIASMDLLVAFAPAGQPEVAGGVGGHLQRLHHENVGHEVVNAVVLHEALVESETHVALALLGHHQLVQLALLVLLVLLFFLGLRLFGVLALAGT